MIEITGAEGSSEYRAALMVCDALEAIWPGVSTTPAKRDDIKIAVSVKISGYKVQDIDVVLVGQLSEPRRVRPTRAIRGHAGNRLNNRPLLVESFVVAIEVKDQDDMGVRINDDQVQVRYSRSGRIEWKSATDQNLDQVHSLKAYFFDQHADVFVRRCLVFPSLLNISAPSAVAAGFNGHQLFSAIASPSRVLERNGHGFLSAGKPQFVSKVLASPLFRPMVPTRLDRERMDRLVAKSTAVDELVETLGSRTIFLRGYGGTGKTVLLLQTAWKQYKVEGNRTLILTYNLALAADMRRLMALMGIPSGVDDGGIEIGTVMSFLYKWFSKLHLLEDEDLDFSEYPDLCTTAIEMITSEAVTNEDIEYIITQEPDKFDFDQIFVDEGQDWPQGETTLLKSLYRPHRLCVADGIDQLTRGQRADWRTGIPRPERKTQSLRSCLRLKRNVSLFVAEMARLTGAAWGADINLVAGGGRLIVLCKPYEDARPLHEGLVGALRADGNAPVDMLFCVPPSDVRYEGQATTNGIAALLSLWGEECWDGVNASTRIDFARSSEQFRIVQYASCRGLEGWTVVLDGFDEFLEFIAARKRGLGLDQEETDGLMDLETASYREAWRWGMIALTRPIDTLVIQLRDPSNRFAQEVLGIAKKFEDFAEIIE
jgi:hypothetical protein